jgi:hypothetical protein
LGPCADLQHLQVERRPVDDRPCCAGRLDGDVEHGVERLRHGRTWKIRAKNGAAAGTKERRGENAAGKPVILPTGSPPMTASPPLGNPVTPDPTRFVLVNTSHAGNVGAAARAMKVMGFGDLVLVRPRFADVLPRRRSPGDGQRRGRRAGARARGGHAGRGAGRHAPGPAPPR